MGARRSCGQLVIPRNTNRIPTENTKTIFPICSTVSTTVKLGKKYYILTSFLPTLCNLNLKKYHHHRHRSLSPTAWLYGINSRQPREPLRDGLVDVAVEGFY